MWSRAGAHGNRTHIAHQRRQPQTLRKKVPRYGRGTGKKTRSACAFFETFSIAKFNKLAFDVFQIKSLKKKKKKINIEVEAKIAGENELRNSIQSPLTGFELKKKKKKKHIAIATYIA